MCPKLFDFGDRPLQFSKSYYFKSSADDSQELEWNPLPVPYNSTAHSSCAMIARKNSKSVLNIFAYRLVMKQLTDTCYKFGFI